MRARFFVFALALEDHLHLFCLAIHYCCHWPKRNEKKTRTEKEKTKNISKQKTSARKYTKIPKKNCFARKEKLFCFVLFFLWICMCERVAQTTAHIVEK